MWVKKYKSRNGAKKPDRIINNEKQLLEKRQNDQQEPTGYQADINIRVCISLGR